MTTNLLYKMIRSAEQMLSLAWRAVYEEKQEELEHMFKMHGDRAYGVWIQAFMAIVSEQLITDGYVVKPGFNLQNSIENWGPPEERERCIWYPVHMADGTPLGTMVLQVYHSHTAFFMPRSPRFIGLEATAREDIIAALSKPSNRVRWDRVDDPLPLPGDHPSYASRWEYATDVSLGECLDQGNWMLDEALSHWGRYGWELVSITSTASQTIGFFKRPAR
ncbi:DUF6022 family protein [Paenibacillus sp. MDMC362]|uniref:DUF6022 family protein n=1 Tax=Paenibacillus sp. MDMC362 TaxID=2977365 RepID=UPI000DC5D932|nr:DUF6022 family protein [Paenibacillus sp. MDMC362]RAR41284.1 hypothetical protein DP091_24910 [Paenibacillus sp. MDMC362]